MMIFSSTRTRAYQKAEKQRTMIGVPHISPSSLKNQNEMKITLHEKAFQPFYYTKERNAKDLDPLKVL